MSEIMMTNIASTTETRVSVGMSFDELPAGKKTAPKAPRLDKRISPTEFKKALQKTRDLMEAENWEAFKPKDLVFLYAHLHEHVYGTLPLEICQTPNQAYLAAGAMVRRDFAGNISQAMEFMRWIWKREKARFGSRQTDFRISWRYMFGGAAMMTDYRIALTRARTQVKTRRPS